MIARELSGTSAGPLPAPVRDLSGTSAVPRSWWTPRANYGFEMLPLPKQIRLGIHSPQEKRQSQKKNRGRSATGRNTCLLNTLF